MNTKPPIDITGTWTQVTLGGDYILQNIGSSEVEVVMSDVAPTTNFSGKVIERYHGLTSTLTPGTVWARVPRGTKDTGGLLSVSE